MKKRGAERLHWDVSYKVLQQDQGLPQPQPLPLAPTPCHTRDSHHHIATTPPTRHGVGDTNVDKEMTRDAIVW